MKIIKNFRDYQKKITKIFSQKYKYQLSYKGRYAMKNSDSYLLTPQLKIFFFSNYDEIDGGQIILTSRQQEIFDLIKENKQITQKELEEYLNINRSAILKHINNLKEKGFLKRVGGTRGYWEVLDGK